MFKVGIFIDSECFTKEYLFLLAFRPLVKMSCFSRPTDTNFQELTLQKNNACILVFSFHKFELHHKYKIDVMAT